MEFRLLGPVEIAIAGRTLSLPRRRERCLLGILLLNADRVVPVGRLTDLLWDGDPPARARRTVHSHVSRLRAVLTTADGGGASPEVVLATIGDGYRLRVDPQLVDAHRFRAMVDAAAATADLVARVEQLRAALDLWRGPALADAASDRLRDQLCTELGERRLAATEELISASLALSREQEILPELARIAQQHPDREALTALHMRALYQAGRKVEALRAYARARAYLAEELGLDPSPRLREVHQAILRDRLPGPAAAPPAGADHQRSGRPPEPQAPPDSGTPDGGTPDSGTPDSGTPDGTAPDRAAPDRAAPAPSRRPPAAPRQLPADATGFTGRTAQLHQLDAVLSAGGVVPPIVISGTAGVGKSALAVHWAHRIAHRFPDGQLYLNLRGFDPAGPPLDPADAVRTFLDALQVPPDQLPAGLDAQLGRYRSLLADRKVLVVLDNAADAGQVRPLLPGAAGCLVVVTSRNQLPGLVATESAYPLSLDLLTPPEARQLLGRRLGAGRTHSEPEAAAEIITRCAGLPLALAIVAARAATRPGSSLRTLACELGEAGNGLDTWTDPDAMADLRKVFSWSYQALPPATARLFRLLGLHPGPHLTTTAAASLAAVAVPRARVLLAELARANLVTEHGSGRYLLHDLLRTYAAELVEATDSAAGRQAAVHRLLDHCLHTADTARDLCDPHRRKRALPPPQPGSVVAELGGATEATAWLTAEHPVLLRAIDLATQHDLDSYAWRLAQCLSHFFYRHGYWRHQLSSQRTAMRAAQLQRDQRAEAYAHAGLGDAQSSLGDYDRARGHFQRSLELSSALGEHENQAYAHLDLAWLAERQHQYPQAHHHAQQAYELFQAAGDRAGQARALNVVGWACALLGDHHGALAHCRRALAVQREIGDLLGSAFTWDSLGYAHHHLGDHRQAIDCYQQALEVYDTQDHRQGRAETLNSLGDAHLAAGDPAAARTAWQRSLEVFDELGRPEADRVRAKLDRLPPADPGRHRDLTLIGP